ncbi:MAG: aminodeoxychorismate synthase component I [Gallicola sp.]|nr:aminodeoxychorismate synthase component I [Gallicola sp.]
MITKIKKLKVYKQIKDFLPLYEHKKNTIFLDSSLQNEYGAYSILGLSPSIILEEKDGNLFENGTPKEGSIEEYLTSFMENQKEENNTHLPLISGFLGYFSYDYGRKFENIETRHEDIFNIPDAVFILYNNLIIEDLENKDLYITSISEDDSMEKIEDEITAFKGVEQVPGINKNFAPFRSFHKKDDYLKAVEDTMDYIEEGDVYILNMTHQLEIDSSKRPYHVYRYLRNHNPAPFSSYMNFGSFHILSSSPERFIQIKKGMIETRPIKGTRKRGATEEEDLLLKEELLHSEKDRSELLMIVDLERNDLNHICSPGSVLVPELFEVETYATVFHLVSTITGKLNDHTNIGSLLRSTFPGGSITGAPKIRAMEIIDELEKSRRGIYTGSIGYFSRNGDSDLNIIIRTLLYKEGRYYLGVGGGITYESDPEFEYEETMQKAKALLLAARESNEDSY